MPIIIDANVAGECVTRSVDAAPIMDALVTGKVTCVTGQRHKTEMLACAFRSLYRQLVLAGRMTEHAAAEIDAVENRLPKNLASNDGHIIALAIVSGARVLFSRDQPLHTDFTDAALINNPRGRVYQNNTHRHLLRGCG